MKKASLVVMLFLALVAGWSCSGSTGTGPYGGGGGGGMTPTPGTTPGPVAYTLSVVNSGSYQYAIGATPLSAPLTIAQGQSVVWDSSNAGIHPLNIDDGAASSCMVSGNTSFPVTVTFNNTGTFKFHCGNHSSCGNGSCTSACTGMQGTLQVN
ncbi:MAG TPA: hypothetical protein VHE12_09625 [bacterium]|nr:hypothetical protein [bacterium]